MSTNNKNQLVTIDDLENFKSDIINSIKRAITDAKGPKKWLKSSEVRKQIGVSPGKLQAMRDSGLLTFSKIGGNIYYDPDDILRMFEENKSCKNEEG